VSADANRSCHRKERHWTQADAEVTRAKCEAKRPGTRLRSYFCDFCLGWHLTSKPKLGKAA
jgi:hypothetical protein